MTKCIICRNELPESLSEEEDWMCDECEDDNQDIANHAYTGWDRYEEEVRCYDRPYKRGYVGENTCPDCGAQLEEGECKRCKEFEDQQDCWCGWSDGPCNC